MDFFYKLFCLLLLAGLTAGHAVGWSVTHLVQPSFSSSAQSGQSASARHK